MIFSQTEIGIPDALTVSVSKDALTVELDDGRTLTAPLGWYPRLSHASPEERQHWRLIGSGTGIHWPDLDEDISIEGLCWAGHRERASVRSIAGWQNVKAAIRSRGLALISGAMQSCAVTRFCRIASADS